MGKLITLWNYLDGKKTAIGAAILLFVQAINLFDSQVVTGIWQVALPAFLPKVLSTLTWIGNCFAGVGLLHKANKASNE